MELDLSDTYMLTIPQAAKVLGLPASTAYQCVQHGKPPFGVDGIPVLSMGDRIKRVRAADVARYVRGQ